VLDALQAASFRKLDALLDTAIKAETPYAEFLDDLLGAALQVGRERYLPARLKLVRLPPKTTVEQLELDNVTARMTPAGAEQFVVPSRWHEGRRVRRFRQVDRPRCW